MKTKNLIMGLLILSTLFLTGCWRYGTGESYGHVTTIEEGLVWDKVWFRAELESSQTDCYVLEQSVSNLGLKQALRESAKEKQRVRIYYDRHIMTATMDCNNDEITGIYQIETQEPQE